MVVKEEPVPVAGLPPVLAQLKLYGEVPPDPVAVNVRELPVSPEDGPLMLVPKTEDETVTILVTVCVLGVGVVESLTVRLTE